MEQRGFRGIWIVLHPLSLVCLPWYRFDPIPLGLCIIPDVTLLGRASPQIGPGQGLKEDKQRTYCAYGCLIYLIGAYVKKNRFAVEDAGGLREVCGIRSQLTRSRNILL